MIDSMTPGMINISQGVLSMSRKITISIPDDLINTLDGLTAAWETTRSGVFARMLREIEKERLDKEMAEGYKAIAETDVEIYLPAQAEVVLRDDQAR
ncbi:MAG: CopG family transcriptional regulator [Firmicutes bacterium]|nr:CopG family transcriptional regulator [Bacillota bacterium]